MGPERFSSAIFELARPRGKGCVLNMRSISTVGVFIVLGSVAACGQILGIEPWQDPLNGESSSTLSSSSSSSSSSTSSGDIDPCGNGVQDGLETGVDCGGGECKVCPVGGGCAADSDCESGHCPVSRGYCISSEADGTCPAVDPDNPSCGDCVKNGTETDVDCGGDCLPCRSGAACVAPGDCWSNACTNDECEMGAAKTRCFSNADCLSGVCAAAALMSDCAFDNCCQ